jgi:GMP synthase-like glutamine amidotransferase
VRALAIVHQPDAGPGVFADAAAAAGVELEEWAMTEAGQLPPRAIAEYDAVMTFGGAMNVDDEDRHPWLRFEKDFLAAMLEDGMPLLGVCLGSQLLAEAADGAAARGPEPEIGWAEVELTPEGEADPLFGPLAPGFDAFQWHSYAVSLPDGAVLLAENAAAPQAYRVGERAWGIQFHAEVSAEDAAKWIRDYETDPDAVRIGLDPEALAAETASKIAAWNALGRELCARFLGLIPA